MSTKYWRVRHKGSLTGNSEWSDPTSFIQNPPMKYAGISNYDKGTVMYDVSVVPQVELLFDPTDIYMPVFSNNGQALIGHDGAGNLITRHFDPVTGAMGNVFGASRPLANIVLTQSPSLLYEDNLFGVITAAGTHGYAFDPQTGLSDAITGSGNASYTIEYGEMISDHFSICFTTPDRHLIVQQVSSGLVSTVQTILNFGATHSATTIQCAALSPSKNLLFLGGNNRFMIFDWDGEVGARRTDLESTIDRPLIRYWFIETRIHEGQEFLIIGSQVAQRDGKRMTVYAWDDTTGGTYLDGMGNAGPASWSVALDTEVFVAFDSQTGSLRNYRYPFNGTTFDTPSTVSARDTFTFGRNFQLNGVFE